MDVLVFFPINNLIIRRRKKLLAVFTKIFSAHRAAQISYSLEVHGKDTLLHPHVAEEVPQRVEAL